MMKTKKIRQDLVVYLRRTAVLGCHFLKMDGHASDGRLVSAINSRTEDSRQ